MDDDKATFCSRLEHLLLRKGTHKSKVEQLTEDEKSVYV